MLRMTGQLSCVGTCHPQDKTNQRQWRCRKQCLIAGKKKKVSTYRTHWLLQAPNLGRRAKALRNTKWVCANLQLELDAVKSSRKREVFESRCTRYSVRPSWLLWKNCQSLYTRGKVCGNCRKSSKCCQSLCTRGKLLLLLVLSLLSETTKLYFSSSLSIPYNEFVWLSRSYLPEKTCQFFFKLFSWLLFVLCWTDTLENVVSYHTVSCYIQGLCIRVVCVHHSCIVAPPIFVCGRRGTPTFRQSSIITYMYKLLSPMFIHILISM